MVPMARTQHFEGRETTYFQARLVRVEFLMSGKRVLNQEQSKTYLLTFLQVFFLKQLDANNVSNA